MGGGGGGENSRIREVKNGGVRVRWRWNPGAREKIHRPILCFQRVAGSPHLFSATSWVAGIPERVVGLFSITSQVRIAYFLNAGSRERADGSASRARRGSVVYEWSWSLLLTPYTRGGRVWAIIEVKCPVFFKRKSRSTCDQQIGQSQNDPCRHQGCRWGF